MPIDSNRWRELSDSGRYTLNESLRNHPKLVAIVHCSIVHNLCTVWVVETCKKEVNRPLTCQWKWKWRLTDKFIVQRKPLSSACSGPWVELISVQLSLCSSIQSKCPNEGQSKLKRIQSQRRLATACCQFQVQIDVDVAVQVGLPHAQVIHWIIITYRYAPEWVKDEQMKWATTWLKASSPLFF